VNILLAMQDAKFVQIDGQMFVAGYSCDPDDTLVADDIVLEASAAEGVDPVILRNRSTRPPSRSTQLNSGWRTQAWQSFNSL